MGRSTDAILAYGYDLGSADDEWKVREVGEYGELAVPWHDERCSHWDDLSAFAAEAEDELLAAAGFTAEDGSADYYQHREEALELLGVTIVIHCSDTAPMFILAAKALEASRGNPQDAGGLLGADEATRRGWDEQLAAALGTLGLTPVAEKPAWLLCSYADGFDD